jgi:hypothetical protein
MDRRWVATWLLSTVVIASACGGHKPAAQTAGPKPQVLTVPQIVRMTEQGESFETIQSKMQQSGTVYRLTDAQAATLRGSGLSATLISFMQLTYTHAVQQNPALAKSDEKWTQIDEYWYGGRPYGWPEQWVVGAPRFGERLRSQ